MVISRHRGRLHVAVGHHVRTAMSHVTTIATWNTITRRMGMRHSSSTAGMGMRSSISIDGIGMGFLVVFLWR